jgi:hypothetical protein
MAHILDLQAMECDLQEEIASPTSTASASICISCLSITLCG